MKPFTNGVERTNLSDLKIGDYIKYGYINFDTDKMGEFTDQVSGLEELPSGLTPLVTPTGSKYASSKGGYFYFIKIDSGTLLADRCIQQLSDPSIPSYCINKANYIKGSKIRCMTQDEASVFYNGTFNGKEYTLGGVLTKNILTDSAQYSNNPDNYIQLESNFLRLKFGFLGNIFITDLPYYNTVFMPIMQYVDNAKSTNIFY